MYPAGQKSGLHGVAEPGGGFEYPVAWAQRAQTAERGKFDLLFLKDAATTRDGDPQALRRWPQYMVFFDPLTLLAWLASVTQRIGLQFDCISPREPVPGRDDDQHDRGR
jgi:alkanesulfonate monooxygenase SsuD/methylene tetrahydromethanopterin reductase-like flavin-dependent oxidoreductase (luciferase family)